MKFVSFETGTDRRYGFVENQAIRPLTLKNGTCSDLKALLPAITDGFQPKAQDASLIPLKDVRLLPPIPNPGKIFCVATNFHEPARAGKPDPNFPLMFMRCAESITGHNSPLLKPAVSEKFDFEGELAVIIGKFGHKISREHAMSYVAGYTCFNDGSVRDWQKHSTQFTPGKNFFQTAGCGPWMVCKNEIPNVSALELETRVDGVLMQKVSMQKMIFDVSWLIEYISTFTPISAGDMIVTGTPSGFGSTCKPPRFLSDGDKVVVSITGIGSLENTVRQDVDTRKLSFS